MRLEQVSAGSGNGGTGKDKDKKDKKKLKKEGAMSEEAAYKLREEESKLAGIIADASRPPKGGDPPPPGRWQVDTPAPRAPSSNSRSIPNQLNRLDVRTPCLFLAHPAT
jgi:hypothetical protein